VGNVEFLADPFLADRQLSQIHFVTATATATDATTTVVSIFYC